MKILVAVDGSDTAWHALSEAIRVLPLRQAAVVVVSVAEPPTLPETAIDFGAVDVWGRRKADAQHRAEAAVRAFEAAGVQASMVVREGAPADEILACAADQRPDLIVMGSHGYGAFERLVLGSVSDAVTRRWRGATMVVPKPPIAADHLADRIVAGVMNERPVCAQAREHVGVVAVRMRSNGTGFIPVLDGERLIGVVTDRDLVQRVLAEGCDPGAIPVGSICTEDPAWVAPGMPLSDAVALMERRRVRRLVVVDGQRVVGVLSLGDLARVDRATAARILARLSRPAPAGPHRAKVG